MVADGSSLPGFCTSSFIFPTKEELRFAAFQPCSLVTSFGLSFLLQHPAPRSPLVKVVGPGREIYGLYFRNYPGLLCRPQQLKLQSQATRVQILILLLSNHVTLGKSINLSHISLSSSVKWVLIIVLTVVVLQELNDTVSVSAQHTACHNKCLMHNSYQIAGQLLQIASRQKNKTLLSQLCLGF